MICLTIRRFIKIKVENFLIESKKQLKAMVKNPIINFLFNKIFHTHFTLKKKHNIVTKVYYDSDEAINYDDFNYFYKKSLESIDSGKHEDAIELLNKVLVIKPDYADAYFTRGSLKIWSLNSDNLEVNSGLEDLKTALQFASQQNNDELLTKTRDLLELYLEQNPFNFSSISDENSELEITKRAFEKSASNEETISVEESIHQTALSFTYSFNLGVNFFNKKDFMAAKFHFEESLKIESKSAQAYRGLGACNFFLGNFNESREIYTILVINFPNDYRYLLGRASCNIKLKQFDMALEDLEAAKIINTSCKHIHLLQAYCAFRLRNFYLCLSCMTEYHKLHF